jgi:hypothetical protein
MKDSKSLTIQEQVKQLSAFNPERLRQEEYKKSDKDEKKMEKRHNFLCCIRRGKGSNPIRDTYIRGVDIRGIYDALPKKFKKDFRLLMKSHNHYHHEMRIQGHNAIVLNNRICTIRDLATTH